MTRMRRSQLSTRKKLRLRIKKVLTSAFTSLRSIISFTIGRNSKKQNRDIKIIMVAKIKEEVEVDAAEVIEVEEAVEEAEEVEVAIRIVNMMRIELTQQQLMEMTEEEARIEPYKMRIKL